MVLMDRESEQKRQTVHKVLQDISWEVESKIRQARTLAVLTDAQVASLRENLYAEVEDRVYTVLRPNPVGQLPFRERLTLLQVLVSSMRAFHGSLTSKTFLQLAKALDILSASEFDALRAEELLLNRWHPLELVKLQLPAPTLYAYVEAFEDLKTCLLAHAGTLRAD